MLKDVGLCEFVLLAANPARHLAQSLADALGLLGRLGLAAPLAPRPAPPIPCWRGYFVDSARNFPATSM